MDNKYIKQEAVLDMLNRFFRELEGHEAQTLVSDIKHAALELPLANDVEEVTRCEFCSQSIDVDGIPYCTYFNKNVNPDGFCSEC